MKKLKTIDIAILGMLTALYVVLSAFLKFSIFGNIMIDLGYIAFAFALSLYGPWGSIVGVLGCVIESVLFSAYGFSPSWAAANLVIGLLCGFGYRSLPTNGMKIVLTIASVALAMLCVKTAIECLLYNIPLAVKIPKNAVAFGVDAVAMVIGLFIYEMTKDKIKIISA